MTFQLIIPLALKLTILTAASIMMNSIPSLLLLSCLALLVNRYCLRRKINRLPYPPGPRPLPVIGNLFDLARENEAAAYFQLSRKYGDLVFLNILGKKVLFVNSFHAANELFEKRSANYSSRPYSPMLHDLMGWSWGFGHMPYGKEWKVHRRMFYRQFQQSTVHIHWPVQRTEAHSLLRRVLHSPQDLIKHFRHNAASFIMNLTYGIHIASREDRYITIAEKALAGVSEAAKPGEFLVDLLPFLKYVPEWVPGAGFKGKAREWKEAVLAMRDAPFEAARRAMQQGTTSPCYVSNLMNDLELDWNDASNQEVEILKATAGMSYAAGTESTLSALSSFVLAVVLHQEVQSRAQQELDRIVGSVRLPDFQDRESLPYISAIVQEVLRWSPVAPLGLPHMATQDGEYNGYFIPAGTTIVGNTWAILRDPDTFPNPDIFDPDRFLDKAGVCGLSPLNPLSATFGYGRRICPGRYVAEAQLWLSIACMLAVFDIRPGHDAEEMERLVKTAHEARFTSGMIRHPLPFGFAITPRGEYARVLIEQTAD